MKSCGSGNVRKHLEIKDSDKYITLSISLKFGSTDKMRITYPYPKDNVGISGKGLINSLSIKAKSRLKRYKKAIYSIGNVSMKDLSKIIRKFEKLNYRSYDKRRPKNEPTGSYFYLSIQLAKYIMRADYLNLENHPVRT